MGRKKVKGERKWIADRGGEVDMEGEEIKGQMSSFNKVDRKLYNLWLMVQEMKV